MSTVQINSGTSVFLKRGHIVRFTSELAIFQAFLYIVTLSTPDVSGAASHNLTEWNPSQYSKHLQQLIDTHLLILKFRMPSSVTFHLVRILFTNIVFVN